MAKANKKKAGGNRKIGRNKRAVNQVMGSYVRGKISFETYKKRSG